MKRTSTTATTLFLAWYFIAAVPATKPSAEHWFDRALADLQIARQKPLDRLHRPSEGELCLMLVHQRGNDRDRALLTSLVPSYAKRVGPEIKDGVEVHDRIVAEMVTLDARSKLLLDDPAANEAVDEALREIRRSGAEGLRNDLARYLALRGQYERARIVDFSQFSNPVTSMSWLAIWFEEGGHADLRDLALRDVHGHVRAHPPSTRDFDLQRMAESHATVRMFDAAFGVAAGIGSPEYKLRAYAWIGETALSKGRRDLVPRALKEARAVPPDGGGASLFKLARLAAQVQDRDAFNHFSSHAEQKLDSYTYFWEAKHLASGYAILGMRDPLRRLMDKAMNALSRKEARDTDGEARFAYAASYVFLDEDTRVAEAIEAAKKLNRRATDGYSFWEIFEAYLGHGRINKARALIEKYVPAGDNDRHTYHTTLTWELVRRKELDAAREEIEKLTHPPPSILLGLFARGYVWADRVDDAAKWIDSFESPLTRAAMNLAVANAVAGRDNYYSRIFYSDWDQRR